MADNSAARSRPRAAAAARAAPTTTGVRAKDRLADHIIDVREIRERDGDSFETQLAENGLQILESLLYEKGVNGMFISSIHQLCYDNREGATGGKLALLHLGRALRVVAVSENEALTVAAGFTPDNYGLPVIKPPAPRLDFPDEKTPEPPARVATSEREVYWGENDPVPLFYTTVGNPIPMPVDEEAQLRICCTTGPLNLPNAVEVDCSRLPPVKAERRYIKNVRELNMSGKYPPRPKAAIGPPKPFKYKKDGDGTLLVKSEMMGEDDFFTEQIAQRQLGSRYEEIAKMAKYEERDIMKHVGHGSERKRYQCVKCGEVCKNLQKFAAHVRFVHPKTPAERKEAARKKIKRAEVRELKSLREENQPLMEGERRERTTRNSSGVSSTQAAAAPAPTPPTSANKIYTCPICSLICNSQHIFASHMRYNHPKDSPSTSMKGRRAAVSVVQDHSEDSSSTSDAGSGVAARVKKEEEDAESPIDTPEKALNALSSVLSAGNLSGGRKKKGNGGTNEYMCRVCGKVFQNINAVAGHTRHCVLANGAPHSARALSRRASRGSVHAINAKAPLPQSPLAANPNPAPSIATAPSVDEGEEVKGVKEVKSKSEKSVASSKSVKDEPVDGEEPQQPSTSAAATAAAAIARRRSAHKAFMREIWTQPLTATAAAAVAAPGAPTTPASRGGRDLQSSVHSTRLSARHQTPAAESTSSPTVSPLAKKARTSVSGEANREAKGEEDTDKEDEEEGKIKDQSSEKKEGPKKVGRKRIREELNSQRGLTSLFARTCIHCGEVGNTSNSIDKHIRDKHPNLRNEIFSCSHCTKAYRTMCGLDDHWRKVKQDCASGVIVINGVKYEGDDGNKSSAEEGKELVKTEQVDNSMDAARGADEEVEGDADGGKTKEEKKVEMKETESSQLPGPSTPSPKKEKEKVEKSPKKVQVKREEPKEPESPNQPGPSSPTPTPKKEKVEKSAKKMRREEGEEITGPQQPGPSSSSSSSTPNTSMISPRSSRKRKATEMFDYDPRVGKTSKK